MEKTYWLQYNCTSKVIDSTLALQYTEKVF